MTVTTTWTMVSLDSLLKPISRPESVVPTKIYSILGAHWYAGGLYIKHTKPGSAIQADKVYRVEQGDFVYNRLFAWKGSFAIATLDNHNCYVSNEFPSFVIDQSLILPQYLQRYFSRLSSWDEAFSLSSGGTPTSRNRLKEEKLLKIEIPLPPLSEQRRIVARIEEIAAKVDEARGLRQFSLSESNFLYGRAADTSLRSIDEKYFCTIEKIAEVRGGIQKSPTRLAANNPVRYLTVAHVKRNFISFDDPRYFEVSPQELHRWQLVAGDVLIIEGNGSADQIGRTALFQGEITPCVHQNHVIRIRPNQSQIEPKFLNLFLNSPIGQARVQELSRTTSGLRNLSVGRINQISVPVPPLDEQRQIVEYLAGLQAKVDALKALQSETAAELDALVPSILDKAFKGEL